MSSLPTAADRSHRFVLAMLAALLLCYGVAALGGMGWPLQATFIAFLACTASALLSVRDLRTVIVVAVVVVLVILSLGSPSDGWDPRSIWLFHAKRIFMDGTLYAQLDDYARWSHNDYPTLVPLLMASAASLMGYWNDLLPKAVAPLLLLPALLAIVPGLRSRWCVALFTLLLLRLCRELLVNGYMDALVAVYAVAAVAAALQLRDAMCRLRWSHAAVFAMIVAVLSMLKNEGVVLAAVVTACVIVDGLVRYRQLHWRLLLAALVGLLPLLAWKQAVANAQISNDLTATNLPAQLLARLLTDGGSAAILKRLMLDAWVLAPLLLMAVFWRRTLRAPAATIALLAALAYAIVLYMVYMGTPHDLDWHLRTSIERTRLPVLLLLAYAAISILAGTPRRNAAG